MKLAYPQEIDRIGADEAARRTTWNARADAIGARLVAARATSPDAQSSFRLGLWKRPDIAALDARIAQASTEFRERNLALLGTPVVARLDPLRPERAWCLLATSALDTLRRKVDAENEQWSLVDRALLEEADRLGVRLVP